MRAGTPRTAKSGPADRGPEGDAARSGSSIDPLAKIVLTTIQSHPDKAKLARTKPAVIGWFVGQVMKAVHGRANAQEVADLVSSELRARNAYDDVQA